MVVTHHRSLKGLPSESMTNNSDDEENSTYKFDFTSFPTIADPEQNKGQTFSHMITSTLRKVTNNASNLVHNYSKISYDDKTADLTHQAEAERDESSVDRNLNSSSNADKFSGGNDSEKTENATASRSQVPMVKNPVSSGKKSVSFPVGHHEESNAITSSTPEASASKSNSGNAVLGSGSGPGASSGSGPGPGSGAGTGSGTGAGPSSDIASKSGPVAGSSGLGSGTEKDANTKDPAGKYTSTNQNLALPPAILSNSNPDDLKSLRSFISTTSINTERSATGSPPHSTSATPTPPPTTLVSSQSSSQLPASRLAFSRGNVPTVHSDSNGLSLSTLSIPRLQPTPSTTDTNINALGSTEPILAISSNPSSSRSKPSNPGNKTTKENEVAPSTLGFAPNQLRYPKNDSLNSLQNRISSIFNNLPNDIELSDDDSTSETDTINNLSFLLSPQRQNSNKKSSPKSRKGTYSSTISGNSKNSNSTNVTTMTNSSNNKSPSKKNSHGHLSSVIFDNAKSIINSGINNVVSSSSTSIMSGRKEKRLRKKKPQKTSDNPLKNGGIPRFYWMNDSFVSDCLNCFKPFTAFRRKHHCRFCGQIFCSDCTLFISYSQHKEERKNGKSGITPSSISTKRNYPDKLRVCKPCYSDVIVYLSDDSSSSDSASDLEQDQKETSYIKSSTPVGQTIQEIESGNGDESSSTHPLSRIRSRSINSRRDSVILDNSFNRGFLAAAETPSEVLENWSPSKQKRLPNTNGIGTGIPMTPEVVNGKTVPSHSLHMAIPTTRKGESVEIPVPIGSYSSTILGGGLSTTSLTGGNVKGNLLATPTNISTTIKNKTWLKNYTYNRSNNVQNSAISNKSNNLDNLSHIYSNLMKKKPNIEQDAQDVESDTDKSSDDPDVESDNEDEQVMSLYTSLNHYNGGVSGSGLPTLTSSSAIGSNPALTSRVSSGQYQIISPSSNGIPLNIVVPTLGEFPQMASGNNRRLRWQKPGQANMSTGNINHNSAIGETPILSRLLQDSQSTDNKKNDILSGEGKSISFIEERPKSDIRSHERANASLLRMRSRRKSKSTRNVLLLTQQNNTNSSFNTFNTSGNNRLPKIDTSFNAYLTSSSPNSNPNSPTPNFNSSTSLSQQKSNEGIINNSPSLFSPAQILLLLVNKWTGSAGEMAPVTPVLTRNSRASVEFDSDMILNDSADKFQPLQDDDEGKKNELEGYANIGDYTSSVVHFESPYKSKEIVYQEFLDKIFSQYLNDSGMNENQDRWLATISVLFRFVDKLKITDTLDTKQYIKIRRLLGGEIEDSKIVDGIFWTKNIDSKKMLSSIDNPRIALLMFPIEYLKQKEQFISLRIVHSQQDVYVTNLVSRLISLEPDVIVVGDTVCGLAEQLLEEAGITVISNTKPQVIERISRYTKADIFQSVNDLFFKKGSLGTCKKLEVKKYLYQNSIKSFVFFTGSEVSSGFTIQLRGGDESTLRAVKNATESTIPVKLNAKFEKSLFEDHYLIFKDFSYHTTEIVETLNDLRSINDLLNEKDEVAKISLLDGDSGEQEDEFVPKLESPQDIETNSEATQKVITFTPPDKELTELLNYNSEIYRFVSQFDERIITSSPAVKLLLPTSLTNLVESYKMLSVFYHKYKMIQNAHSIDDLANPKLIEDQFSNIHVDLDKLPYQEVDLLKILKYRSTIYLKTLRTNFQSRLRVWSNNMSSITLDPQKRNNIYVLNSTVSIKYATPCYGPVLVVTDNYTENDLCLGLFLDKIFTEASEVCSECGDTYLNHYRTYSHGNGKLDMILEQIQSDITSNVHRHDQTTFSAPNPTDNSPNDPSKRYMWSYCTICNSATPVVPMSDDTFYLSIGKFFELCFWGAGVIINSHECGHDFFKHHVRYIGFKDLAIKMVYSPIDTYEVIVPKKQLEYLPDIDIQLKIESLNSIRKKSSDFFSSISNRLNRVKIDTIDKMDDGLNKVEEFKKLLDEQIQQIETKTMEIYNSTLPSIHLPLNSVLRNLQELGVGWDNDFVEFEKDFLPSENEITRITQFHLRKFLIDKYSDEENKRETDETKDVGTKEVSENEEKGDTKSEKIEDKSNSDKDKSIQTTENEELENMKSKISDTNSPRVREDILEAPNNPSPEFRKQIDKLIPSSLLTINNPLSSVMEKIHKMEALLENERQEAPLQSPTKGQQSLTKQQSSINPKSPFKKIALSHKLSEASLATNASKDIPGLNTNNKVHSLAKFFDQFHFEQISAEFKKQRELELEKKMNRYKAFPVVASKPIVEIYNKIEDAVDVDDKRDTSESRRAKEKVANAEDGMNNEGLIPSSTNGKSSNVEGSDTATANASNSKVSSSDIPQPEKNSLLKSLTNFWADRSATLWDPLDYPLCSSEHTFADSDVIVREDEPSSLIAFCLSSTDYKQKLQSVTEDDQNQKSGASGTGGVTVISNAINNKKAAQFANIEKKFKKNNQLPPGELENIMNRFSTTHLKYQYLDGQTTLSCKIFYSEQFEAFRKACGNENSFIQSLSRCVKWDSSGGKSGSSFLKTLDNRYIVKELSKQELESFVAIAPFYFKYMSQSMFNTLTTAIAKIFGFYQIHIRNPTTGRNFKMDFLIMENLFYNKKTTRIFDLKGSMRNRHVQQTGKENEVLLDENMIEYIYESPVFVRDHSKKLLRGSLFNDTAFLSAMDVMDYSLVIGIVDEEDVNGKSDPNKKQLYVGIIDCIRTFTWDKKVENWVKGTNLIGGKKGKDPTIITPKQYRTRFREAMERYILEVPDCWYNF